MPVINGSSSKSGNNRILPTNSRSVDVARSSIDLISKIQNKRYDNAFQVEGFEAILYSKKKGGLKCMCQTKNSNLGNRASVLDKDGNASQGVINELLTGQSFGVVPYGAKNRSNLTPIVSGDLGGIFDEGKPTIRRTSYGAPGQGFARPGDETANTRVVTDDGFADDGPVSGDGTTAEALFERALGSGYDSGFSMTSDVACSICFGTSFVGGFDVYQGFRLVLESQALLNNDVEVNYEEFVPPITGVSIAFKPQVIPRGAFSLDSLKAFNSTQVVAVKAFVIDGVPLATEQAFLGYCDGLAHQITVEFNEVLDDDGNFVDCTLTHLEIQFNQSSKAAKFEFPKLVQNAVETLIERTDPFQIIMSPVIPNVANGDIITDSTYSKTFQVTSSNWWNDRRRAVLGWECDVRPCQPQELYTILPKRRVLQSQSTPNRVRSNLGQSF